MNPVWTVRQEPDSRNDRQKAIKMWDSLWLHGSQEPGLGCLNPTFAKDYMLVLNYSITNYIFKRTYKLTILIEFFLKIEKHVTLRVDEYLLWLLYLFDLYF